MLYKEQSRPSTMGAAKDGKALVCVHRDYHPVVPSRYELMSLVVQSLQDDVETRAVGDIAAVDELDVARVDALHLASFEPLEINHIRQLLQIRDISNLIFLNLVARAEVSVKNDSARSWIEDVLVRSARCLEGGRSALED